MLWILHIRMLCLSRIVLEAGYFLDYRAFFENLVTILVYAVIVSTQSNTVTQLHTNNLIFQLGHTL